MSQQGPLIVVSTAPRPSFATALDDAQMFPLIDATWADASRAIEQVQPAAVLVAMAAVAEPGFEALAQQIAARKPYLPLIAVDPQTSLPENAIPFSQTGGHFERLAARLRAALRVRTLHATVLRRLDDARVPPTPLAGIDPARDATVLLIGRGSAYPALSGSLARSRSKPRRSISTSATSTASCSAKGSARAWSMPSSPCSPRIPASAICPWWCRWTD